MSTAVGVIVSGGTALLGPGVSSASSHREAPLTLQDPTIDNTDTYAFTSPDKPDTTTLVANWIPFEEPAGGPNFYPFADDARYNIKIDSNGDAKPDITYRWTFSSSELSQDTFLYNNGPVNSIDDETLVFKQTYKLEQVDADGNATTLVDGAPVAPSNVGEASMPNYSALRDEAITSAGEGTQSFAGQADDSFFLDLRVFDLLYGGDLSETGSDTLDGYNVNSVALQVPTASLTSGDDPVIGVWSTTERPSMRVQNSDGSQDYSGDFTQVSRLGNPLVNEVVAPTGLKDAFNALPPENDATVQPLVDRVNDPEVPKLIEKIYGIPAPATPREDIFSIFLTGIEGLNKPAGEGVPSEMLRLNTSTPVAEDPSRLGVLGGDTQGFPNGRRLSDDVVDIELQALEGAVQADGSVELVEALAAGDGVNSNDKEFGDTFPYLALPHSGSGTGTASTSPEGGVAAGAGGTAAPAGNELPVLPLGAGVLGAAITAAGVLTLRKARS